MPDYMLLSPALENRRYSRHSVSHPIPYPLNVQSLFSYAIRARYAGLSSTSFIGIIIGIICCKDTGVLRYQQCSPHEHHLSITGIRHDMLLYPLAWWYTYMTLYTPYLYRYILCIWRCILLITIIFSHFLAYRPGGQSALHGLWVV